MVFYRLYISYENNYLYNMFIYYIIHVYYIILYTFIYFILWVLNTVWRLVLVQHTIFEIFENNYLRKK